MRIYFLCLIHNEQDLEHTMFILNNIFFLVLRYCKIYNLLRSMLLYLPLIIHSVQGLSC